MSILIKGMELPKNCGECQYAYQDQDGEHNVDWVCAVTHKILFPHDCRDDCPLVEIPPHGRLIDADAYKRYLDDKWIVANYDAIDAQPTIIEAEENER